jgi:hypothetical protein
MALHHHNGDVVSTSFSPVDAFFFIRLMIGVSLSPLVEKKAKLVEKSL